MKLTKRKYKRKGEMEDKLDYERLKRMIEGTGVMSLVATNFPPKTALEPVIHHCDGPYKWESIQEVVSKLFIFGRLGSQSVLLRRNLVVVFGSFVSKKLDGVLVFFVKNLESRA